MGGKLSVVKDSIVLFDMDGTLTEARKKASWEMVRPLKELSQFADIGIVTGSPMSYLMQQCKMLWSEIGSVSPLDILLMPCNGTQFHRWSMESRDWYDVESTDMRSHIGTNAYRTIVREIFAIQSYYCDVNQSMPLTGNFISDRRSMINWSPVGRDADDNDRKLFIKHDNDNLCRVKLKESLEFALSTSDVKGVQDIVCTLGGHTSIDIYPKGWDKTYALRHLGCYDKIYFVGDKCDGLGNDKTIYDALQADNRSFMTTGPKETINIIRNLIPRIVAKDERKTI